MKCRNCGNEANIQMIDLGMSPLCEDFLPPERLATAEVFLPLNVMVCDNCFLVQLEEMASPAEIFTEYAYFSSFSDSWLDHCHRYADMAIDRFGLDHESLVVEIASNDGYLLRWFVDRGIGALGIEPAANVAEAARELGIETEVAFFGCELATDLSKRGVAADLIVANNVLAQVPDLHDFVGGFTRILSTAGVVTLEFPHVLRLMQDCQFDTIYHEHFSYFSLHTCRDIFARHGLEIFDVDELPTHGGSLRLYLHRRDDETHEVSPAVEDLLAREEAEGLTHADTYLRFSAQAQEVKRRLLSELIAIKDRGESIAAYGAAGKGNTLLNFCGIRTDFLDFVADRNPYKVGRFTPGTHIPIVDPSEIERRRPDHLLILPWNLAPEISGQLGYVADWGADLMIPIPTVRYLTPGDQS